MRGSRVAVGPFSDFFLGRLDFSALTRAASCGVVFMLLACSSTVEF